MDKNKLTKIIFIVGPTASGKSDLALRLALRLNSGQAKLAPTFAKASAGRQGKPFKKRGIPGAEIISADSRQVYRGMDIGTGKVLRDKNPKSKILNPKQTQKSKFKIQNQEYYFKGIRHHLINVLSPKKQFTADDFKRLGEKAITDITSRHTLPIIVGGTGFYIDVLLGRIAVAEVPPNKKLRAQFDKLTAEKLFEKLQKLDPQRARTIDRYNKRRLIRALEIAQAQNKKMSLKLAYANFRDIKSYRILWLGINPGKDKLAKNIKIRLARRLEQGMIKEVQKLHNPPAGGGVSWKRLDDFGLEYRWISRWLKNPNFQFSIFNQFTNSNFKKSDEYKNLLRDIIRYSKRQMTWFKRNKEIHWLKNQKEANGLIKKFIYS
ncbi:MAG: tRNA (adenosine(37)-N6)-dimethylallyltransferase MiaA [Candidatus Taylorbacteria bacterium]|nr:tRNA (adenosine(37)-N6)-dimethylallyltransferase MiaA [Candidatus Taylorbacteria bacterium]